jgi:hypothetical protein
MGRLFGIALLVVVQATGLAQAQESAEADRELLERLQDGGLVLLFRHGNTGPNPERPDAVTGLIPIDGSDREREAAYYDCERQRNLSDTGRAELRTVAAALGEIGLVIGGVFASPMCRTRESAWLLAGRVVPSDGLIGNDEKSRQRLLTNKPGTGRSRILVTHGYVLSDIVPNPGSPDQRGQLPRSHAYVLEPAGSDEFKLLGQLGPEDWVRLAELAQQNR